VAAAGVILVTAAMMVVGAQPFRPASPDLGSPGAAGFGPGARVLMDAHNTFPNKGRWTDRMTRALGTGVPLAIEQDLFWRPDPVDGHYRSVVAHRDDETPLAPTFETHFFEAVKPIIERALAEDRRDTWPVIVLNLDFKTNEPEHHAAVWALLGKYESWLTTATRTATPERLAPLDVGPMLVLSGSQVSQGLSFHDRVPVGQRLRIFGAIPETQVDGATAAEKAATYAALPPERVIPTASATNYRRWANFSWGVVEYGVPTSGPFTADEEARVRALVARAHAQGLWIRFYTLNGHPDDENQGWTGYYSSASTGMPVNVNFGSLDAARQRWRAAIAAGADFIATDQYELLARELAAMRLHP
jgi:hypothetical protein